MKTFQKCAACEMLCISQDAADEIRLALHSLSNEILGALPLLEQQARQDMGNTNYSCLMQRAEEARALLASK